MTAPPVPTLAMRLTRIPSDRLYVRLDVARGVLAHAMNPQFRLNAMNEIDALRAEIQRRGMQVPA